MGLDKEILIDDAGWGDLILGAETLLSDPRVGRRENRAQRTPREDGLEELAEKMA